MKKKLGMIVLTLILVSTTVFASGFEDYISAVKLLLNGQELDQAVVVYNGTSYLPVRAISEALGLTVGWDGETETISLESGENEAMKELEDQVASLEKLLVDNNIKVPVADEKVVYLSASPTTKEEYKDVQLHYFTKDDGRAVSLQSYYENFDDLRYQTDKLDNAYDTCLRVSTGYYEGEQTSEVTYATQGQYDKFKADLTQNIVGTKAEYVIVLEADGVEVYTGKVHHESFMTPIEVDIKGAKLVTLRVIHPYKDYYDRTELRTIIFGNARFVTEKE